MTLRSTLPDLVARLVPDALGDRPNVVETRATCGDCAMCDKGGAVSVSSFRPDAKCCTYHPTIPNYLVGALLADATPELEEGRTRVRARIASRMGVTPEWLAAPRKTTVLHHAARGASFGRSLVLLCPYFARESGSCTIWKYRESVCTTFFCKYEAGALGQAFWHAFKDWLTYVERRLVRWAAQGVAPGVTEPEVARMTMTLDDLEDRPPADAEYAGYWRDWVGREEDFYGACAARVSAMTREEFAQIADDEAGLELRKAVEERYDAMASPKLAEHLVKNPEMRIARVPGAVGVTTYSRYDSLLLVDKLYDALDLLRADEPSRDAAARLARETGLPIDEDLLLSLQLHEVVVPPRE